MSSEDDEVRPETSIGGLLYSFIDGERMEREVMAEEEDKDGVADKRRRSFTGYAKVFCVLLTVDCKRDAYFPSIIKSANFEHLFVANFEITLYTLFYRICYF